MIKFRTSFFLQTTLTAVFLLSLISAANAVDVHPYPIVTARRLKLTQEYCALHYALDTSELKDPQIIILHTTDTGTLEDAEKKYKPDFIETNRTYLWQNGEVNAGAHFLVDYNGNIYSMLPLNVVARHTIGLNYTSIAINNVGYVNKLTPEQLKADAALIADLIHQLPSLHYLVGHYEVKNPNLPHYKLFMEKVPEYHTADKLDPGPPFMEALRSQLKKENIELEK